MAKTIDCWMHLLLFCLYCHYEIHPAAGEPEWKSPQFPCDVTSNATIDCKGRRLHKVPHGIPSFASQLDLEENLIQNISTNSFSNLPNLTKLDLSWANRKNGVNIDVNAFKNLTKLYHLKLTGINLNEIPRNIPRSVKLLELNYNHIVLFNNRSLKSLENVTHLQISKNCYTWNPCNRSVTITEGSFKVITKLLALDLSFNNITEVPKGLPRSLTMLELGSNKIQYISENDFYGLHKLKILKIQGNCPRCQNAPYPCVPCPNGSLDIHPNAFNNLTQLQVLNLGGNSLDYLNPSWFLKLSKLKELYLSFNFLTKVITDNATFLRYIPKVRIIDLSFNFELKKYPKTFKLSEEFSKLRFLRTLHLMGLVFQSIEPDTLRPLYKLENLTALNLGTNFIINCNASIFSQLPQLKMIYLAENRLYPVTDNSPPHVSGCYSGRSDLTISPILTAHPTDLDYELSHGLIKQECFNSGRVLILSSNNLFFISSKQFDGYENIACLNLSGNGFSAALNGTEFSALPNVTYLDLSNNRIDLAYDNAFKELNKLQVLDISYNAHYFEAYGVTNNLNFLKNLPNLRVLNMSHNSISRLSTKQMYSKSLSELQFTNNNLGNLWKERDGSYNMLFTNLTNLTILDISHNTITKIPHHVYDSLPHSLTLLRISHNSLTDFRWDRLKAFCHLKLLDLSFNKFTNVTGINANISQTLVFLDLSHNHILDLDFTFNKGPISLTTLSLSNNKLTTINQSTFQLGSDFHIQTLFLQRNPFECTCDLFNLILWIKNSGVKIPRLTPDVTCGAPENRKGQLLIHFDINQCVNNNMAFQLYILTMSFIATFMLVATAAHLFYWDASYLIHYLKAKLKRYKPFNSPDCIYDVFVTYDTKDSQVSEWVMRNLRVKLEDEGEKHLPLCLEDRDWAPGVPLIDNLTQSIRYSRKTLFILTEGYVKTGVFKLAMYLAHQRLLDENVDVIVLLMLEPVLQHSHFLRLRRRLCGKSVLEWPRTAAAEPWFWQNLRNVVRVDNQVIYSKTYSKYFTTK
ncbi:toll-like receptor 7 isoform X2 [Betta splendens]|uniref:Toll-like receptor 7 isoform X2 n=1 Tax=Betta splendens TaxID=158456 RepID=A0A6P7LAQ6_BETSP|nr:toll-like receptor 7 isoform X2 [Betta splendens]